MDTIAFGVGARKVCWPDGYDSPAGTEILRVGAGMHGAHRYDETYAIGGGYLAAAPDLCQLQLALRRGR